MRYRGSYLNGFAPRDFEPAYPELWRGCVGAWCPSLGPTGGVLRDWSGRQNHGTLTGTTLDTVWANQQGYCLAPDGTDDYVLVGGEESTFDFDDDKFTCCSWVCRTADSYDPIFSKRPVSSGGFEFSVNAAGQIVLTFAGVADYLSSTAGGVSKNNWHHIAAVVSGTGGTVTFYLNGVADGVVVITSITQNSAPLTIGAGLGISEYFGGQIDDLRIYNRVLSQREISLLYSNGRGRGIAYSFNQPRGSLTPGDSSGSSGGTFPGLAWRALRKWRFVMRAGIDEKCAKVT